jgi:hypothetical protein
MDSNGSEMVCNAGGCGLRGGRVSGGSGWVMVLWVSADHAAARCNSARAGLTKSRPSKAAMCTQGALNPASARPITASGPSCAEVCCIVEGDFDVGRSKKRMILILAVQYCDIAVICLIWVAVLV